MGHRSGVVGLRILTVTANYTLLKDDTSPELNFDINWQQK